MPKHRIIIAVVLLISSLAVFSLGVGAGHPGETPAPLILQPRSLPGLAVSSAGREAKLLCGAPVGSDTNPAMQDHLSSHSPSSPNPARPPAEEQAEPGISHRLTSSPSGVRTFQSIADTCVLQGRPDDNFGDSLDMWVGYDESVEPHPQTARSFVQFDLSTIPQGAKIKSATLWLALANSWDYPGTSRTVSTWRVPSAWAEDSLTWNDAPAPAEGYGTSEVWYGDSGWYDFDVTNLVKAWHDGTYDNDGIMIRGPEVSGDASSRRGFHTREGERAPELDVEIETVDLFLPLVTD